MKKMFTCNSFTGNVYYGTVDENKKVYKKKEEICREQFEIAMINYLFFKTKDKENNVFDLELQGRKFKIEIKETE